MRQPFSIKPSELQPSGYQASPPACLLYVKKINLLLIKNLMCKGVISVIVKLSFMFLQQMCEFHKPSATINQTINSRQNGLRFSILIGRLFDFLHEHDLKNRHNLSSLDQD